MAEWENKVPVELRGQFRNLVFEGGGVWGIAYEGVLDELGRFKLLDGIQRVGGASAGAITACLLAAGYTGADLGEVLRRTNFKDFTDDSFGLARDTARLLTQYGWYKGEAFRKWVRKRVREKTNRISDELGVARLRPTASLRELRVWQNRVAKKGRQLPELYLIGSNLSKQRREVYSAATTPTVAVVDAVRASMSIPIFFASAQNKARDVLVDGGLTWNYPVNLFDDMKYLEKKANGLPISYAANESHVFNSETLGFRLDTTGELKWNLVDWENEPFEIDNILHYGWALVSFMRAVANKVHLHKNDWTRTVFVDVGEEIGFTDFDLTDEQLEFLAARGRQGVRDFLKWRVSAGGMGELRRVYRDMSS